MKFVRPRCYFDVELSDIPLGRIVFELYSDICPITCENFRSLCTGEKGIGKTTGKNLHYLNIVFHRVVKGFMIQSGDFSVGNGTGGESIYGGTFEDENFELKHDEPFLLSMANRGKDTNGSQFFITTQPAPHLDGIHVVFGHVVSGQSVVLHIENLPVDKVNRPLQDVRVVRCNELVLKSKLKAKEKRKTSVSSASEVEAEDKEEGEQSDSEDAKRKKKRKKEKKHKKKKKKSRKHSGSDRNSADTDEDKDQINPITGNVCKINPAEIPDVPSNKFLLRGGREEKKERGRERDKREGKRKRENIRGYTKSGRVIKGRGVFRYRTPSRSRSRSFTPPHWKQAETRTIKLSEFQKLEQEKAAKEEEIKRREEARKRRHEEREKEVKLRREENNEDEGNQDDQEEDGALQNSKPQRLQRGHHKNLQHRLGPKNNEMKKVEDTGPVDYNALDYDDEMEPEEESHQVLAVNSKRSDEIVASMFSTLKKNGEEGERSGDDKENTRDARKPPPLDRSPSPGTRRAELEAVLRSKLLLKKRLGDKARSNTRSASRDKVKRRRTISTHEERRKRSVKDSSPGRNGKQSGRNGKESRRGDAEKSRDKKGERRNSKRNGERSSSGEKLPVADGELFPDKEAAFSATLGKKKSAGGEKASSGAPIGESRSRDKFKTTRKRSSSRSQSRRGRRRSRSRDARRRSRSPRRKRRAASSSESRERKSRHRDGKSRSKERRSRERRSRSREEGEKGRSDEAKRKLTARLKEIELKRRRSSTSESSSSES